MVDKLRILIADDHEQFRWAIERLLSVEFDVVATVADGRKLVDKAMALLPDIVVTDLSMPRLSGIQAMEELHNRGYKIPFVLLSTDNVGIAAYVERGVKAFVQKVDIGHDLVTAVFSAAFGCVFASRNAEVQLSHAQWRA